MKTTMKQLATGTILALLLIAVTANVNAKGKEALKASSLEISEAAIELESWMVDENIWSTTNAFSFDFEEVSEESLELENWMISAEIWNNTEAINTDIENEIDLKLENWMISSEVWNR